MQQPYLITGVYADTCNRLLAGTTFQERVYGYAKAKQIYKLYDPDNYKELKLQMILSNGKTIDIDPDKIDVSNNTVSIILMAIIIILGILCITCQVSLAVIVLGIVGLVVWWLMFQFVSELTSPATAMVLTLIVVGFLIYVLVK